MRFSRMGLVMAAAAMSLAPAVIGESVEYRPPPKRYPRRHAPASEMNRKQSRAANRSKKQFLIKGVRP